MKVHHVNEREIAAAPERLGAVLATAGREDDRLWPTARWPTIPLVVDGPLAPGTPAHHGSIGYVVEAYEPGKRLLFRFDGSWRMQGVHGLEIEPLGPERTRVRYLLDAEMGLPHAVIGRLMVRMHDAVVEDMFDNLERESTGAVRAPVQWSRLVRVAAALERLTTRPPK